MINLQVATHMTLPIFSLSSSTVVALQSQAARRSPNKERRLTSGRLSGKSDSGVR